MVILFRICGMLLFFSFTAVGCSFEASINDLNPSEIPESAVNHLGSISVSPSVQREARDESGEFKVESAIGEVTTSESASTQDGVYRAEISIRYQEM